MCGQHASILNTTLKGVNDESVRYAESAKQLEEPLITAENEFARIMETGWYLRNF